MTVLSEHAMKIRTRAIKAGPAVDILETASKAETCKIEV